MAQNTWSTESGEYRSFDFDGINQESDAERLLDYGRVHRRATIYLATMAPQGLTAEMLDGVDNDITAYQKKIINLKSFGVDRNIATQDRRRKGNDIYAELVKTGNTGKT